MTHSKARVGFFAAALCAAFLFSIGVAEAATLSLSPATGVYSAGSTFTARVVINTAGSSVNAAEGQLSFNPRELSVISISRASSIFNLWTAEPSFSNAAGTITFGGGSPQGYKGSSGTVVSVVFRALSAGTPKVTFTKGSVLAADGFGTNVLTAMSGGSYTTIAEEENPEPEYVAPPNTPAEPKVHSSTHPDPEGWYSKTSAELTWEVPSGITAVRTLLDQSPGTIPTIVYEEPISSRTIEDLPEGVSYFHIQFRNDEGWGRVAHYRLGVDTKAPHSFIIEKAPIEEEHPEQALIFKVEDISPVVRYVIQLDGSEPAEFIDEQGDGRYVLAAIAPGHHTIIVEAFDAAGNSLISTYSFDIEAFEAPVFTEYPDRLSSSVTPVIKGTTLPNVSVLVAIVKTTGEREEYSIQSGESGSFMVIPDGPFDRGVYDMTAVATDAFGAMSKTSEAVRFIVEEPGYIRIGTFALSVLSVIVPLLSLLVVLIFGVWYLWHRLALWRKRVLKETREAEHSLAVEFDTLARHLSEQVTALRESRKGKLTKAEEELIAGMRKDIDTARKRIQKELSDIDDVLE